MCQPSKDSHQIPKESPTRQLNLYAMTKQSLIKKIHILAHELSIHHAYQLQRQQLLGHKDEKLRMELVEREIVIEQMKKNEAVTQGCLKEKSRVIEQLTQEKSSYQLSLKNLRRQSELINKKLAGLGKAKSREMAQKIDQRERALQGKMEALQEENRKMKVSLQEMRSKIKILTDLNAQTEDKLAEALSQALQNDGFDSKTKNMKQSKENVSPNIIADSRQESSSLGEQIRKVKAQLKDSQQARERLRHKLKQRQQFYSKMLASKNIQS